MDDIIEAARLATAYVETHSSVSTGGQTATGGENVQTGDATHRRTRKLMPGRTAVSKNKIEPAQTANKNTRITQPIEKAKASVEANASIKDGDRIRSESERRGSRI